MWRPGLGLAGKGGERRGVEDTSDVELHDLRKTGIGSGSGGTVSVQSARCHLAAVSEMFYLFFYRKESKLEGLATIFVGSLISSTRRVLCRPALSTRCARLKVLGWW